MSHSGSGCMTKEAMSVWVWGHVGDLCTFCPTCVNYFLKSKGMEKINHANTNFKKRWHTYINFRQSQLQRKENYVNVASEIAFFSAMIQFP
jgi:hypothetical protein